MDARREYYMSEIRRAMWLYEKQGKDWLLVVEYLIWKANSTPQGN